MIVIIPTFDNLYHPLAQAAASHSVSLCDPYEHEAQEESAGWKSSGFIWFKDKWRQLTDSLTKK